MQQAEHQLRITDALELTGLSPKTWDNLVSRVGFTSAQPTTRGVARMFTVDDVCTLYVIRHYLDLGAGPSVAARVGADVGKELAKAGPGQEFFWIVRRAEDKPGEVRLTRPPDNIASTQFPLAVMRRTIREAVGAKLAAQRP